MSTYPNGSYHIYLSETLPPLVTQIFYDFVFQAGEPHGRHVGTYKHARIVRLQEVTEPIATPLVIRDES